VIDSRQRWRGADPVTLIVAALLNERDREIVVLLSSGYTKLTEVAEVMGYGNHGAASKRLTRIREQSARFFDIPPDRRSTG
jgi:hypothetical protein